MKNKKVVFPALATLMLVSPLISAADNFLATQKVPKKLSFSTSFKTRTESLRDFDFNSSDQDFTLSQIRLGMTYRPSSRTEVFVQLQDARIFGEELNSTPGINKRATPNIFQDELDVHEAYVKQDFDRFSVKVGRQKFNLGDQRLVASLEWVNTARVKDGVRFNFNAGDQRNVDVFFSALVPVNPTQLNNQASVGNRYFDSNLHGIYVTDKNTVPGQIDYWYFHRQNQKLNDATDTYGGRYLGQYKDLAYELQASIQNGEFGGQDHSASMVHVGASYPLGAGKAGVAYNFGSGDSDPNDSEHNTFDNLFPLNHAYYGFMDLFSLQNIHNFEATYSEKVLGKYSLRAALQGFWIAEEDTDSWYNAGLRPVRTANVNANSYAGSEIDLTLSTQLFGDRLQLLMGYSHFFAGNYLEDTGTSNDASWYFLQLNFKPKL
ncbi:MAG: alginate export family protein [Pseudohongiellaceae bacterium]